MNQCGQWVTIIYFTVWQNFNIWQEIWAVYSQGQGKARGGDQGRARARGGDQGRARARARGGDQGRARARGPGRRSGQG